MKIRGMFTRERDTLELMRFETKIRKLSQKIFSKKRDSLIFEA